MAGKLILCLNQKLLEFPNFIMSVLLRKLQPGLCIADVDVDIPKLKHPSIKDIWNEGLLWGVPKHRRSLQKRLNRKFGWPKYNWKPLVPKTNLLMCKACGNFHEADTVCGHCYEKVKIETSEIQESMEKEFKLNPIKDDIIVLYKGEDHLKTKHFWKNQRIIEQPKSRPSWFHHNLLESSSQKSSDDKEVKPNDLA